MNDKKQQLYDRLEENLFDFHEAVVKLEPRYIVEMADRLIAVSDAYAYLTNQHGFTDSEVEYLMNFQNPLEVVTDEWQRRRVDISDMSFALDEAFDKQDALRGGYPLIANTQTDREKNRPAAPKPSIHGQLRKAARKAKSRPAAEAGLSKADRDAR